MKLQDKLKKSFREEKQIKFKPMQKWTDYKETVDFKNNIYRGRIMQTLKVETSEEEL